MLGNAFWLHLCNAVETEEEGDGDTEVTTDGAVPKSYFSYAPYPNFSILCFFFMYISDDAACYYELKGDPFVINELFLIKDIPINYN